MRWGISLTLVALAIGLGSTAAHAAEIDVTVDSGELGRVRFDARALTFTDEEETFRVVCELEATFRVNESIAKTAEAAFGQITGATTRNCRGGTVRLLGTPWNVQYDSFTGTLPEFSSVRLRLTGVGVLFTAFFGAASCLYGGTLQATTGTEVEMSRLTFDETAGLTLVTRLGGIVCPGAVVPRGIGDWFDWLRGCAMPAITAAGEVASEAPGVIPTAVTVRCNRTRIDSITTTRPEVFRVIDRERAIGTTRRRRQNFQYDIEMINQRGIGLYNDNATINVSIGRRRFEARTRLTFNDVNPR
jgi:hypothetical protein